MIFLLLEYILCNRVQMYKLIVEQSWAKVEREKENRMRR